MVIKTLPKFFIFNIPFFAELAKDQIHQLNLGQVVGGIVSPVHDSYGKESLVSSSHRTAMLRLGLETSDWIKVSDWETQQDDWTRTKHVLQYHSNKLNATADQNGNSEAVTQNSKIHLKLLCGGDLLESFAKPGLWKEEDLEVILEQFGLVVVGRSGSNTERFIFESDQLTRHRVRDDKNNSAFALIVIFLFYFMAILQKNIILLPNWEMGDMSSTLIRTYLKRGQSAKYLLDDKILNYIKKNGIYSTTATM